MDRIKFLKFFFYLTDVGPDNGPHCYLRASHDRKPSALRRLDRITDEEILRHYGPERVVEVMGVRGTAAAVDTRGFHKGKPLTAGHRLIFQHTCVNGGNSAGYIPFTLCTITYHHHIFQAGCC